MHTEECHCLSMRTAPRNWLVAVSTGMCVVIFYNLVAVLHGGTSLEVLRKKSKVDGVTFKALGRLAYFDDHRVI